MLLADFVSGLVSAAGTEVLQHRGLVRGQCEEQRVARRLSNLTSGAQRFS